MTARQGREPTGPPSMRVHAGAVDPTPWHDAVGEVLDHVEARIERQRHPVVVRTGYPSLDRTIEGLKPGEVVVISSDPGIGKTTVALDICRSATFDQNRRCLFLTGRSSRLEIATRILSAQALVGLHNLRAGSLHPTELAKLQQVADDTRMAGVLVHDGAQTVRAACKLARAVWASTGVDLIIIEDVDQLEDDHNPSTPEALFLLASLAQETCVPVVTTAQLRSYSPRDPAPSVFDRSWPGGGSNAVGLTILVDRPEAWRDPPPDRYGEVDLYAQRQHRPRHKVTLSFQGHYSRLVDANGLRPGH